jgi:citrate lyase subunit beta/citryl-CoA lyase
VESKDLKARINRARTFLFVPGDQPERIAKAVASKSDAVIIDLEDAVRPEKKVQAREALALPPTSESSPLLFIRVNAFGTPEFEGDLLRALQLNIDGIVIPKFVPGASAIATDQDISRIESADGRQDPLPVIGLIESTAGVLGLLNSSWIPGRVLRLAFGGADLHADLGITISPTGPNSDLAMAALVMASVHAGLGAPIDTPHFKIGDDAGLAERSLSAARMGFGGKLCIHPAQLEIVDRNFAPQAAESEWASRVIARWNARDQNSGALLLGSELIDEAMVKRAKQILGLL